MDFSSKHFTDKAKIQLLQRSILVNSYAYYELKENIQELDKEVFFLITDTYEIYGGV